MNNACTTRFIGPGISPQFPTGYTRYTDHVGHYIRQETSGSCSPQPTESRCEDMLSALHENAEASLWASSAGMEADAASEALLESLGNQRIVDVLPDAGGVRLVIDPGYRPEPRVYTDLWRPEYSKRSRCSAKLSQLPIAGSVIAKAAIDRDVLELSLSDGTRLRCPARRRFEAWQVVAEGVGLLACLPGGQVAVFSFDRRP
jgi:hypothetical protein